MQTVRALSVFGLGYVGCVSAACFASRGHHVVGVDVDPAKVDMLGRGDAPIVEERIGELVAEVVASRSPHGHDRLRDGGAGHRHLAGLRRHAVHAAAAGSRPSTSSGSRDEIGAALRTKDGWHTVVYRSTMLPGTCEDLLVPRSSKRPPARRRASTSACA